MVYISPGCIPSSRTHHSDSNPSANGMIIHARQAVTSAMLHNIKMFREHPLVEMAGALGDLGSISSAIAQVNHITDTRFTLLGHCCQS